jgi:hypothetical protein
VALVYFLRPSLRKGAPGALSSAAWQEIRVRSGRDDKGKGGASIERRVTGLKQTAGPSATLRFGRDDTSVWERTKRIKQFFHSPEWTVTPRNDKGEGGASIERRVTGLKQTAGRSATLRSSLDDNSVSNVQKNSRSCFSSAWAAEGRVPGS